MSTNFCVVYCTCPDDTVAKTIASSIIEADLARCVNIVPKLTSVYRWENKVQIDDEVLLIIKTNEDKLLSLEKFVVSQHPYDVPEFIALPIVAGSEKYLDWLASS